MPEPRIVRTRITKRAADAARVPARPPRPPRDPASDLHPLLREEPARPKRRRLHPAFFGMLLVAGGVAAWGSIARDSEEMPPVWNETTGPDGPTGRMVAHVKPSGSVRLLRLEWPAHPTATSYRIRFLGERGLGPAPVPVQSTVFLYDMETNVLHLPYAFDWIVTAVLPDGSEVVTPTRHYPE